MKKEDIEPARILSRPGEEQGDANTKAPEDPGTGDTKTKAENQSSITGFLGSVEDVLDPLMGKGETIWPHPFVMFQKGVFKGLYNQPLEQVIQNVRGFIHTGLSYVLLVMGYYFSAVYFDNDEKKMFRKSPYKETSINELAKRPEVPFNRQQLTDCLRAACVDMELRKNGHHLENLAFLHLAQLGRLKTQQERFSTALEADEKRWTLSDLENKINTLLGKTPSDDKRIVKSVIKPLKEMVRMSTGNEIEEFFLDKDRLKAALSPVEVAELLQKCSEFGNKVADSKRIIKILELTLAEIQADISEQHKQGC
jgi:hypothetical protein